MLQIGKPIKFTGKNSRAWLQSIRNIFESRNIPPKEEQKVKYAVSF